MKEMQDCMKIVHLENSRRQASSSTSQSETSASADPVAKYLEPANMTEIRHYYAVQLDAVEQSSRAEGKKVT